MGVHTGGGLLGQISVKYYQTYLRFAWVKNEWKDVSQF